jgi:hypothetical protein
MKRISLLVAMAAMVSLALITGCSNGPVKPVALSPVQIATIACPQLNLLHSQFDAMNKALAADPATAKVGAAGAALLAKVDPINQAICIGVNANPNVTLGNLQDMIKTGLPALGQLAQTLPMTPQQQVAVQSGLAVGETLIALVNALQPLAPAAAASTAQSAPASAASAGKP